mgnify:CR=1 FL=1
MVMRPNPSLSVTLWTSETKNSHISKVDFPWKIEVMSDLDVQLIP